MLAYAFTADSAEDPSLQELYATVEVKAQQAREKYEELESLRRTLRSSVVA